MSRFFSLFFTLLHLDFSSLTPTISLTKTLSLISKEKKSKGVKSGGRRGKDGGPSLPFHQSRNVSFSKSRTKEPEYGLKTIKTDLPNDTS